MSAGQPKKRNGHQSYNPSPYEGFPNYSGSYSTPETPSNEFQLPQVFSKLLTSPKTLGHPQDEWGLMSKLALASISSQGTMGGLLLGGLLLKVSLENS